METLVQEQEAVAVRVPVTIEVDSIGYERVVAMIPGPETGAVKFEAFMNGLCADFVGGGLMLSPDDMAHIADYKENATPDDIIQAMAGAVGMSEGQMQVTWTVDPSYWEPLRAAAATQGLEVEQVIQNLMDYAVNGGWFFALDPMPKPILMTPADYTDLEQIIGKKNFTGTDIVQYLRKAATGISLDELFPDEEATAPVEEAAKV